MPSVRLSAEARRDLEDVGDYTAEHYGLEPMRRFMSALRARFLFLANYPRSAALRTDYARPVRILVWRQYRICYEEIKGGIRIVRVLHHARDLDAAMKGS